MKLCNSIYLLGVYFAASSLPALGGDWIPSVGDSWNYNLDTPVKTNLDFDVFLIDMDYAQSTIDTLHENGKYVVCYISIGSWEEWREDAGAFPAEALGQPLSPPFEDELWLDVNNEDLRAIMVARVQQASSMNCDGIEPDNMDVYLYSEASAGFDISEAEQIVYNTWFADTVHDHGMVVGLKNSVELLADLVDSFDFAINEQCNEYNECRDYNTTFLEQDKPVFNVEYDTSDVDEVCDYSNALGMDTIFKAFPHR